MGAFEKLELIFIVIALMAVALIDRVWQTNMTFSNVLLAVSALMFTHSLIRDSCILLSQNRKLTNAQELQGFCLESLVAALILCVGLVAYFSALSWVVHITSLTRFLLVAFVLGFGFCIKDFVVVWRPWGIRREKDHLNLIVKW